MIKLVKNAELYETVVHMRIAYYKYHAKKLVSFVGEWSPFKLQCICNEKLT